MPTCPAGHDSASSDFCDVCGMKIGGAAPDTAAAAAGASPPGAAPGDAGAAGEQPPGGGEPCPQCGTGKSGRFCETCGYDFDTGTPAPVSRPAAAAAASPLAAGTSPDGGSAGGGSAATAGVPAAAGTPSPAGTAAGAAGPAWTAVAASDRAYYDAVIAAGGPDAAAIEFPAYCPERRFTLTGKEMRIGRHSASRGLYPEIDLTGPPTDPGISRLHAVLVAEPDGGWSLLDPGSENGTQVNGNDVATGGKIALHDGDRIHVGAWTVITIHAS